MNTVINVGPVALNGTVLSFILAWLVGYALMKVVAGRLQLDIDWIRRILDRAILIGFIAARLSFVAVYWQAYLPKPWTILFFWQAGYYLWVGALASMVFVGGSIARAQPTRWASYSGLFGSFSVFLLVGFWSVLAIVNATQPTTPADITKHDIPNFQLRTLGGEAVEFADLQGKPVILNFWATWCPPCRAEMPLLNSAYLDSANSEVAIIAINVSDQPGAAAAFINEHDYSLPVWVDGYHTTNSVFSVLGGQAMPTTLFIDQHGAIQTTRVGELNAALLQQGLNAIRP